MEENKTTDTVSEAEAQTPNEEEVSTSTCESAEQAENAEPTNAKEKKRSKKTDAEIAKLTQELSGVREELLQANDKYMRVCAEYDNFRRRSAKEREGVYADAYIDALTQILPILDNLERAAQYSGEDSEHPLAKGLELTLKSFTEVMAKMGVSEIEALGKPFDPNIHNAVMHVDDESFGENEVVEVFMKGYIRGDKVLRHSMVKVAN